MKKLIILAIFCLCLPCMESTANAFVFGPTNLGFRGYPAHSCYQPSVPYSNSRSSLMTFKSELDIYKRCIEEYTEGADKDMERVLQKRNEAVDEYNNFIRSIY